MHSILKSYASPKEIIMRTTLDLPENLLKEAMELTHIGTKTAVIIKALEEMVRKSNISGLKKYKGKIDLDIDLNELRDRH
jgi:Arc/MetJ family transcription regulator